MIKNLRLEGFRAFKEHQDAGLAPLTLVYGPNSAGKSTLVRSLLLMQQSVLLNNSPFPLMKGPLVDLGSTRTVAHDHRGIAKVSLLLESPALRHFDSFEIGLELDSAGPENDRLVLAFNQGKKNHRLVFKRFGSNLQYLTIDDDDSAALFESLESTLSADSSVPLFVDQPGQRPVFEVDALLPVAVIGRETNGVLKKLGRADLNRPETYWGAIGSQLVSLLKTEMESVSYLGPLRRPWERTENISQDMFAPGVGATGQHALAVLARQPEILSQVNSALKNALESSYRLSVTLLNDSDLEHGVGAVLPPLAVPLLEHRESGVQVSPVDAGFGLSQLLPIVIEMNVRRDTLICIEQPELHLHPRLQARVGQLLRNAVMGANGNRFLIETHSEHLLLRLRRLIREGLLPAWMVSVLYVDNWEYDYDAGEFVSSSESHLEHIELDDRGEFVDPWPGGFFEDRLAELPGWDYQGLPPRLSDRVHDEEIL